MLAVVLYLGLPRRAGMALILRRAALDGFRGAVPTVLGLELGLYLWALAAGAGFAALVATSKAAYLVLRVLGAGVLVYLGLRAWRGAWRIRRARTTGGPQAAERPSAPAGVPVAGARGRSAPSPRGRSCSSPTPRRRCS